MQCLKQISFQMDIIIRILFRLKTLLDDKNHGMLRLMRTLLLELILDEMPRQFASQPRLDPTEDHCTTGVDAAEEHFQSSQNPIGAMGVRHCRSVERRAVVLRTLDTAVFVDLPWPNPYCHPRWLFV